MDEWGRSTALFGAVLVIIGSAAIVYNGGRAGFRRFVDMSGGLSDLNRRRLVVSRALLLLGLVVILLGCGALLVARLGW
jgi:dipeptide/tripeptide permease